MIKEINKSWYSCSYLFHVLNWLLRIKNFILKNDPKKAVVNHHRSVCISFATVLFHNFLTFNTCIIKLIIIFKSFFTTLLQIESLYKFGRFDYRNTSYMRKKNPKTNNDIEFFARLYLVLALLYEITSESKLSYKLKIGGQQLIKRFKHKFVFSSNSI